jgi:hypothetical protein
VRGDVVVTMDVDLQADHADIPQMIALQRPIWSRRAEEIGAIRRCAAWRRAS